MILRNCRSAWSIPAAVHLKGHIPGLPPFHVALGLADDLDHRLDRVRRRQRPLQRSTHPEALHREGLVHPFAQALPSVGVDVLELRGEDLKDRRGPPGGRHGSHAARSLRLSAKAVTLGKMVGDVSFLVADAPPHRGVVAKHRPDRFAQCLPAIQYEHDSLLRVEASLDQVGEQCGRDGRVLGRSLSTAPAGSSRPRW